MTPFLAAFTAFVMQAAPVEPPRLDLEQKAALRCATAFAIVAALQARGGAIDFPPLEVRGKEFFVRATARIMDDTGATREQLQELVQQEADSLTPQVLDDAMPACLLMLEASGV